VTRVSTAALDVVGRIERALRLRFPKARTIDVGVSLRLGGEVFAVADVSGPGCGLYAQAKGCKPLVAARKLAAFLRVGDL